MKYANLKRYNLNLKIIMRYLVILFCFMHSFVWAHEGGVANKKMHWPFEGMTGKFDRTAIQRGFKVYREVCSACHSLHRVAFRSLADIGFSEAEIKALAAEYQIADGPNQDGDMFQRPGRPSDYIPGPYANEQAARAANNNALPPDFSLIVKAREDGANYIYSILTGYQNPPADVEMGANMHYNPYFITGNGQISMPPPLIQDEQVQYTDGTKPTIEQMAYDVVNFLQWAAEPEMEQRKNLGFKVLFFLVFFTILFYFAKKRIWQRVK